MVTRLTADRVLVTIGTPCTLSAVGGTETTHALVDGSPELVLYAAFDAGLVELAIADDGTATARWPDGRPATVSDVEQVHGADLRADLGIRRIDEFAGLDIDTDIAARLPHDLARGGLRRLAGLTYAEIRESELRDLHGLFSDDPGLGPSLQSQLFAHAGLGALAALPRPLSELLDDPYEFRVVAASAFNGLDASTHLRSPADSDGRTDGPRDKFAARLASSLMSHGGALVSTMLAPSYPLSKTAKNPALLATLPNDTGYMRVPQTPLNTIAACAASLVAFSDIAPQMIADIPGARRPRLVLWSAADGATGADYQVVEAFGPNALVTSAKLDEMNAGRANSDHRTPSDSLAPFDRDACGTVVGDGGSGLVVTTLDFALRHFLDITSIIVGWGQSAETGGKAHFAGVGFGGENALIHAFDLAAAGHGLGVSDFGYLAAHATGTVTNSKTDLTAIASARHVARARAGQTGAPGPLAVGAPKALGDGHTMGETGLKAVAHALRYLLGRPAVGVPTFRQLDPALGAVADQFDIAAAPVAGREDGGAICATQGFGGYNGAVTLRGATPESIGRYDADPKALAAYLERWPQVRRERELRERRARTTQGSALDLALEHRWRA